jgi:hypothetical protein
MMKTIKKRYWLPVLALLLVYQLIVRAPLALVYGWLQSKNTSDITLVGLSGNLSSGEVLALQRRGTVLIEALQWQFQPQWLLLGQVRFRVFSDGKLKLDGHASVSATGLLRLSDMKLTGEVVQVAKLGGLPYVPVGGQVGITLQSLHLRQGLLNQVEGKVALRNLSWTLAKPAIAVGEFDIDLSTQPDRIEAVLKSTGGYTEGSGKAQLKPDQSYQVNFRFRPKVGAPEMLPNLLQSLGSADPEGFYSLKREGSLTAAASTTPTPNP